MSLGCGHDMMRVHHDMVVVSVRQMVPMASLQARVEDENVAIMVPEWWYVMEGRDVWPVKTQAVSDRRRTFQRR